MYNLFDALKNPKWLDRNLAEADIVTLTLTLSYLSQDNYFVRTQCILEFLWIQQCFFQGFCIFPSTREMR